LYYFCMSSFVYVYQWKSRDLRKSIVALLKSWFAIEIKKMNYVNNFMIKDNKVEKIEEKLVIISTENEEKFMDFLSKNFPQFERIYIK